ncbi:hypothetical protein D3C84_156910 [compost metagenome]
MVRRFGAIVVNASLGCREQVNITTGTDSVPYLISDEIFATKALITERCRQILKRTPDGCSIDEAGAEFLFSLFLHHDEWAEKSKGGVSELSTQTTIHGTRCFVIRSQSGAEIDISFPHAVRLRSAQVLSGFLTELWEQDRNLAQDLLDSALEQPAVVVFLPALHSAAQLDERGIERLKRALSSGRVEVGAYRSLAFGGITNHLVGASLKDLLLLIADQLDGFDVALEILCMRLFSDRSAHRAHEPKVLEAGRELLQRVTFGKNINKRVNRQLADVVKASLTTPDSFRIAAELAARLKHAVAMYETRWVGNDSLLKALLVSQPVVVLEALFAGEEKDERVAVSMFYRTHGRRGDLADSISCEALIAWCEGDRERRYSLATSIITFACHPEASGPQIWSEQAKTLLANAPDPKRVLTVLIGRFRPMRWSGSRAALIEANAQLLNSLELEVSLASYSS